MIRQTWGPCAECNTADYLHLGLCYECGVAMGYIEPEEEEEGG